MPKKNWKEEIEHLRFDRNASWTVIVKHIESYFPELTQVQLLAKARTYIRRTDRYMNSNTKSVESEESKSHKINEPQPKEGIELKKDGTYISTRNIEIQEGVDMTPEFIIKAHGLDASKWAVVSYINNQWDSQVKGGKKLLMFQSKLTVKPKHEEFSFELIDEHFKQMDREHFVKPVYKPVKGNWMAEVNLADLHVGKLCWRGDTPENFDSKIARKIYYDIIQEIVEELSDKKLEYILFVWANDFFNSDNNEQTTTGGTPQDTDLREKKLFNVGVEMLVRGIEILKEVAPVKTFYTPSNHDELSAYHALKYLEAWFRNDNRVSVDTNAYPRKYIVYGNTLIGFCHGYKESDRRNKDKASRLASLMPIEAPEYWSQVKYREFHTAHLHSEQMIQEINGVIVRRISSPTAADHWHTENGYLGAVRKAQTFLYNKETGLRNIINTPVVNNYN